MKRVLLIFAFFCLYSSIFSQGLEDVYVEKIPVSPGIASQVDGLTTDHVSYRIFLNMDIDYGFVLATGLPADANYPEFKLFVKTTTEFYNNEYGTKTGEANFLALAQLDSGLIHDSYICVGGAFKDKIGVPLSEDSDGYIDGTTISPTISPGLDLSALEFGTSGSSIETTAGTWGITKVGGAKGPNPETNMVMIGQFTTDGELSYELNVILKDPSNTLELDYVARYDPLIRTEPGKRVIQFTPLIGKAGPGIVAPEIEMTSPSKDTLVEEGKVLTIKAEVNDEDGTVETVELRQNSVKIAEDNDAPFEFEYTPSFGNYVLSLVAIDNDSITKATSSRILRVREADEENPPTVSISSPADQSVFEPGEEVIIIASADDLDGTVDSVEFFIDDSKIGSDLESPFEIAWTATLGEDLAITAKATDDDGLTKVSETIMITVAEPQIIPPTVVIASPADNSEYELGEDVTILAQAEDEDGSVAFVEFFVNDVFASKDESAPYSFIWTAIEGNFTIKAVATDNDDNVSEDALVNINVVTSITLNEFEDKIRIYPNPTEGRLFIEYNADIDIQDLKITDASGRTLITQQLTGTEGSIEQIDIQELETGMYYLMLKINNVYIKAAPILKD